MNRDGFAWRVLLAEITRDPQERQRLADAMGVNPVTLTRWASTGSQFYTDPNGEKQGKRSRPQLHSLRKLVAALPEYRDKLLPSILQEFQELTEEDFLSAKLQSPREEPMALPGICYEQVLEDAATFSGLLRFTTVFDRLFDYAILQLDPERLGLWVSLIQCTSPPPGGKVRSLRELLRVGTPPWKREPEERNMYLGAESLSGRAISSGRSYTVDDLNAYSGWLPTRGGAEKILSIAVCPIRRSGRIAGCMFFASTQPGYFTKERMRLIQRYSDLAQVAFDDTNFYAQQDIALRLMPSIEMQVPILRLFNKRVEEILAKGETTNRMKAEQIVAQQLEEDFIFMSTSKGPSP